MRGWQSLILWGVAGLVVAAAISFGLSYLLTSNGAEAGSSPWVVGGLIGVATMGVISNRAGRRKVAKVSGEARAAALAFTPPDGAGTRIVVDVYEQAYVRRAD